MKFYKYFLESPYPGFIIETLSCCLLKLFYLSTIQNAQTEVLEAKCNGFLFPEL